MSEANYPIDEALQEKDWSLEEAFGYCTRLTRSHYENFPVGSVLLPKKIRPQVCAVYAFARRADDIADEDFVETDRLPALRTWQNLLEKSLQYRPSHPVFLALRHTIKEHAIPPQLFRDLLTAFKMDVTQKRHQSFADLLFYCQHSANPVGRIILHLFGYQDEALMLLSDKICTALQLTNFWQDIAVDLEKNRIYLPQEDLKNFNYSEANLFKKKYNPEFIQLLKFQVERSQKLFYEGAQLSKHLKGRLKLEIKCVVLGGLKILEKLKKLDYNSLHQRPVLNNWDKLTLLSRALFLFGPSTKKKNHAKTPAQ